MKTGIELVAEERKDQLEKHGFTVEQDLNYKDNQLIKAAFFCINPNQFEWPRNWDTMFGKNIASKDELRRLVYAASFIVAKIDCILSEIKEHN